MSEATEPQTPRLLSFVDAMCSWCYGFTPVLEQIRSHFTDRLDHYTFAGGLRPFNTEPMTPEWREKLSKTYATIAEMTGQRFTTKKLFDPKFIYDTEPASRAIVTMRFLKPGMDYSYYLTIQNAFYAFGEDITQPEILGAYAEKFEVRYADFLEAFNSDDIRQSTLGDFQVAKNLGIDGFPTLVLHRVDGKNPNALLLVGQGYAPADEMISRIEAALAADV